MIQGYIQSKTRQATDKEIKTTIYNAIINTEHIGHSTIDCQLLIQHVSEHLENIRLTYTLQAITRCLDELLYDDTLYRTKTDGSWRIGRTQKKGE